MAKTNKNSGAPATAPGKPTKSIAQYLQSNKLALGTDMTKADWMKLGQQLLVAHQSVPFLIGDWLLHGDSCDYTSEELYADIEGLFGITKKTIQDYKSISKNCVIRVATLSFSHHACVMSLDAADQEAFLHEARDQKLTVARLKERVAEFKARRIIQEAKPAEDKKAENDANPPEPIDAGTLQHAEIHEHFWNEHNFDVKCKGVPNLLQRILDEAGRDVVRDQLMREDTALEIIMWLKDRFNLEGV